MKKKLDDIEQSIIQLSRSVIIVSLLFIVIVGIFASSISNSKNSRTEALNNTDNLDTQPSVSSPTNVLATGPKITASLWEAPAESTIPKGIEGEEILYGKDLIANTAKYLGPKGSVAAISNGMNCQNCHNDAGKKPWGNNYSAVYSTYPKFRARSGTKETIVKRVNDCFERSLNGKPLDSTSREMRAIKAYLKWLGSDVKSGEKPAGVGLQKLTFLDRSADINKGAAIYDAKCMSCHGKNGQGLLSTDQIVYTYPPLWGKNSYNDGAGLYRLGNFASFVKNNMPFGVSYLNPQLSEEESWDVAAYVNSQPRPHKNQTKDWKDISQKPIDFPFGPYADKFSEKQHKYGPFKPIDEEQKLKSKKK